MSTDKSTAMYPSALLLSLCLLLLSSSLLGGTPSAFRAFDTKGTSEGSTVATKTEVDTKDTQKAESSPKKRRDPLSVFRDKKEPLPEKINIQETMPAAEKEVRRHPIVDPLSIFRTEPRRRKKKHQNKEINTTQELIPQILIQEGTVAGLPAMESNSNTTEEMPLEAPKAEKNTSKQKKQSESIQENTQEENSTKIYVGKIEELYFSENAEEPKNPEAPESNVTTKNSEDAAETIEKISKVGGEKKIYLTFDDGPIFGTANVIKVFNEKQIKASMFFVGREVDVRKHLFHKTQGYKNILIGNHTYTHANGHYTRFYSKEKTVLDDIAKARKSIGETKYLRLCGRNVWRLEQIRRNDNALDKIEVQKEALIYDKLKSNGYNIFGWDIEWRFDHHTHTPLYSAILLAQKVASRYTHGPVKKGKIIVLAHDYMFRDTKSISQLGEFIDIMKKAGWVFESVDTY